MRFECHVIVTGLELGPELRLSESIHSLLLKFQHLLLVNKAENGVPFPFREDDPGPAVPTV